MKNQKFFHWSPLPPERSGIADYVSSLSKYFLKRGVEVSCVTNSLFKEDAKKIVEFPVIGHEEAREKVSENDISVFHFGNHLAFHGWMLEQMLRGDGFIELHDLSFADSFFSISKKAPILWERECRRNNYLELLEKNGAQMKNVDRLKYNFLKSISGNERAFIVHSDWAKNFLEQELNNRNIVKIALGVETAQDSILERKDRLLKKEHRSVVIIGGIAYHKRLPIVIESIRLARQKFENARFKILGRADDPALLQDLREMISKSALEEMITIEPNVSDELFRKAIEESALAISLRWPTAGETSYALLKAIALATPIITSRIGQMHEFPDDFCYKITPNTEYEAQELASLLAELLNDESRLLANSEMALKWARDNISFDKAVDAYLNLGNNNKIGVPVYEEPISLSVVGDLNAPTGLAEVSRRLVSEFKRHGISLEYKKVDVKSPSSFSRAYDILENSSYSLKTNIRFVSININEFHLASDSSLRQNAKNDYVIANWFWELPFLPEFCEKQVRRVDELWVGSNFVRAQLGRYFDGPITVMPPIVIDPGSLGLTKKDFGLDREGLVFLFSFDANSTYSRKNPSGVIEAFRLAVSDPKFPKAQLVLKSLNLDSHPEMRNMLYKELQGLNSVVIDEDLNKEELFDLYRCCDVFVSLHRTEGFGLNIAEAMLCAKPVIVTAYSGNLDFNNSQNSALVDYKIRKITRQDHQFNPGIEGLYEEGNFWAEPNAASAANWMKILANSEKLRLKMGTEAKDTIQGKFNQDLIFDLARSRLGEIKDFLTNRELGQKADAGAPGNSNASDLNARKRI